MSTRASPARAPSPAVSSPYGRGATSPSWAGSSTTSSSTVATSDRQDLVNANCIVIMGSNMAEAHPVGFQWVMEARERGAEVIHVDPRFSRTSAVASRFVPLRAGSDIAFLGGLVNYILEHGRDFRSAGPRERQLHRDHGLEHGGGPSGRLPVGDGGARARGGGHPCRPALLPHERRRQPFRPPTGGERHRLPGRDRQLHPRARSRL